MNLKIGNILVNDLIYKINFNKLPNKNIFNFIIIDNYGFEIVSSNYNYIFLIFDNKIYKLSDCKLDIDSSKIKYKNITYFD
jgi:hypothetical protein